MASPMRIFGGGVAAFALLAAFRPALVAGQVSLDLCASLNTAETERNISIYQTNGLCKDFCMEDYAYAITQDNACWCSNLTPDNSVREDLEECDTSCPAYPAENCGGRGLFGYVVLNGHLPSGTQGAESSAAAETSVSPPCAHDGRDVIGATAAFNFRAFYFNFYIHGKSLVKFSIKFHANHHVDFRDEFHGKSCVEFCVTFSSTFVTHVALVIDSVSFRTNFHAYVWTLNFDCFSTQTGTSTSTEPPESTPSVETVTNDGSVTTVTVSQPTQTDPDAGNATEEGATSSSSDSGSGLTGGAIAGVVVGSIAGVAAIAGLLFWFMRRKKKDQSEYEVDPSVSDRGGSSGHMGPEMAAAGGSQGSPQNNSNRNSTLLIDPRMDPFQQGLYARTGSHESINTLRDDHDYSRRIQQPKVLRATNPDPSG